MRLLCLSNPGMGFRRFQTRIYIVASTGNAGDGLGHQADVWMNVSGNNAWLTPDLSSFVVSCSCVLIGRFGCVCSCLLSKEWSLSTHQVGG